MYESHFQLRQTPFSIAPDPEFLYLSNGHREALAHLTYGLTQGGFVLITGEVGTGKTTLLRNLLQQMPPEVEVAFILNPRLTVRELLETLCDELGIDYPHNERSSVKNYIDALNEHLLNTHASGRSTVVIIDEAQNLAPAVLEQIRLLTNLETDKRKLLRIILLGQPELLDLLARKELRQLAQRITARYHLRGLDRDDTFAYVIHRLQRAGGSALIFTRPALGRLYRISGGIPRVINLVADRALLGTYAEGGHRVKWRMIGRAAREVLGVRQRRGRWAGAAATVGVLGILFAGYLLFEDRLWPDDDSGPAVTAPAVEPAPADTAVAGSAVAAGAAGAAEGSLSEGLAAAGSAAAGATAGGSEASANRIVAAGSNPGDARAAAATASAEPSADAIDPAAAEPSNELASAGESASRGDAPIAGAVTTGPATAGSAASTSPGATPIATPPGTAGETVPATPQAAAAEAELETGSAIGARQPARSRVLMRPEMTTFQSQRLAYQAAFARWGADFTAASLSTIPCDFAPTAELQCLGGSGTWSDLRSLNLPAVLELWDNGATPFYGAVIALSGDQVTLNVGGADVRFDVRDLADNWFGGYVLLWRMPPDYTGSLKQGDRHPSVGWVRGQLESLGIATPGVPDRNEFDTDLRDAVIRFQESEAMLPDGVIGPLTWIRLAQRLGFTQPRLHD